MSVKLNPIGLKHARTLVKAAKVVHDEHDGWGDVAPTADEENAYIEKNGWERYSEWHLGIDPDESEETKGRYSFPFGDFTKVHRGGVIAAESRAAQNDYDDIAKAAKNLLTDIDS